MNIVSDLPDFTISAATIFFEEEILSDLEDFPSLGFVLVSVLLLEFLLIDFFITDESIPFFSGILLELDNWLVILLLGSLSKINRIQLKTFLK